MDLPLWIRNELFAKGHATEKWRCTNGNGVLSSIEFVEKCNLINNRSWPSTGSGCLSDGEGRIGSHRLIWLVFALESYNLIVYTLGYLASLWGLTKRVLDFNPLFARKAFHAKQTLDNVDNVV